MIAGFVKLDCGGPDGSRSMARAGDRPQLRRGGSECAGLAGLRQCAGRGPDDSRPAPARTQNAFEFRTKAAGWLEARLLVDDALPEDNRAILEIPSQAAPKLAVYSDDPESLRPLFAANPQVNAVFLRTSQYDPKVDARIVHTSTGSVRPLFRIRTSSGLSLPLLHRPQSAPPYAVPQSRAGNQITFLLRGCGPNR